MPDIVSYLLDNGKYVFEGGKLVLTSVPGYSIQFVGYVLSDQGELVTERGFIYGTSPSQLNSSIISTDTTLSLFKASILASSGTYYYKAYAKNVLGTSYGELKSIIAN
jgi:hypothetical protein